MGAAWGPWLCPALQGPAADGAGVPGRLPPMHTPSQASSPDVITATRPGPEGTLMEPAPAVCSSRASAGRRAPSSGSRAPRLCARERGRGAQSQCHPACPFPASPEGRGGAGRPRQPPPMLLSVSPWTRRTARSLSAVEPVEPGSISSRSAGGRVPDPQHRRAGTPWSDMRGGPRPCCPRPVDPVTGRPCALDGLRRRLPALPGGRAARR